MKCQVAGDCCVNRGGPISQNQLEHLVEKFTCVSIYSIYIYFSKCLQ